MNPSRTSMNDMKRRVAGILDFIGRTQVEMATEVPLVPVSKSTSSPISKETLKTPLENQGLIKDGTRSQPEDQWQDAMNGEFDIDQFKHLGSLEMMEVLTRKLMKWQGEYGKYGEK